MDKCEPIADGVVSKSILERAEKRAMSLDWYCVPPEQKIFPESTLSWVALDGFEGECDSSNGENLMALTAKCPKLQATAAKKPLAPSNRFVTVTTSDELSSFSEGFVPSNTEANTEWAVRNFKSWADWRLTSEPNDPIPRDLLTCGDASLINKWLSLYVIETRKQNVGKVKGTHRPHEFTSVWPKKTHEEAKPGNSKFLGR